VISHAPQIKYCKNSMIFKRSLIAICFPCRGQ
jgi:hypothetical protein